MIARRLAGFASVVAGLLILAPSVVQAQKGGMRPVFVPAPAPAASTASAHHVSSSTNHPTRTNTAAASNRSTNSIGHRTGVHRADVGLGGDSIGLQNLLNITPTSGFDYQFVNAINSDLAERALVDPVTQLEIAQATQLLRANRGVFGGAYILGGGGYYVPSEPTEEQPAADNGGAEGQQAPAPQPQIIVLQQAPPQNAQGTEQAQAEPAPPIPDEGQFALVLHNGKQIETVAFTHTNGKIIYITPEGRRASIASGDLDADATVHVNQERGTPLQLPL